jgi:hypothetical protein
MTSSTAAVTGASADDAIDGRGSKTREHVRAACPETSAAAAFDYSRAAELFPTRSRKPRRSPIAYKRFARAADAVRFAIEELPSDMLLGAYLQVEDERFGSAGIRKLYDNESFPLKRRVAPRR